MNTKTMRLPPRRVLNPTGSNKRKERDGFDFPKTSNPKLLKPQASDSASTSASASQVGSNPGPKAQLLASYLAREYLTKGTLLGKPPKPSPSQLMPPPPAKGSEAEWRRAKNLQKIGAEPMTKAAESREEKHQRYVELASLLKNDGVHIPGIVNPSQLAQFLQM